VPTKLSVVQNYVTYLGYFARAPLELWGAGSVLIGGLLEKLEPYGASLGAVFQDSISSKPAEHSITFELPRNSRYRFSMGGLRAECQNGTLEDLERVPAFVSVAESWLRSCDTRIKFSSHLYSFGAHVEAEGKTSEQLLLGLSDQRINVLGRNRGAGVTFHADADEGLTQIQLQVDHSLVVHGGLFVQFVRVGASDAIDHPAIAESSKGMLYAGLEELGLELDR
jgi:hypothetical protein